MKTALLIGAIGSLVLSGQVFAQLVSNGSFESPPIIPNSISFGVTALGWSGPPALINGDGGAPGLWPGPQDAAQYADIGNSGLGGSTTQVLTITVPGNYLLAWYDNTAFGAPGASTYDVAIIDSVNTTVSSQAFGAFNAGTGVWQAKSLAGALAVGSYTVQFRSTPGGVAWDALIDNVSLVPEPGCYALIAGLGLVAFAGYRRYRK